MKRLCRTLAALLWAWAAVAASALPALVADSAALDRSDIPALMLSNGKDLARAYAAFGVFPQQDTEAAARPRVGISPAVSTPDG